MLLGAFLRNDHLRSGNFANQFSSSPISVLSIKTFADAVCHKVALQRIQSTVKGAQLRCRSCIQPEDNAGHGFNYGTGKGRNYSAESDAGHYRKSHRGNKPPGHAAYSQTQFIPPQNQFYAPGIWRVSSDGMVTFCSDNKE
jgi:hypothetical protein